MGFRCITPQSMIRNYLNNQIELKTQALINELIYLGEEVVAIARERHKYKDQTGNLSSSIGYCIAVNGRVVHQSVFELVASGTKGQQEGAMYLLETIANNTEGIVFAMVAGMPYAEYVNAMGLDVLDSAENEIEKQLPEIKRRLGLT